MNDFDKKNLPEILQLKVTPRAKIECVKMQVDGNGELLCRVYVHSAAEDGKANKAVIALLSKEFSLPTSSFTLVGGNKNRNKRMRIKK